MTNSIVWKLTLLVGVLVALNGGVLIGVAFLATSTILRDQFDERLRTVAADRQEMLLNTLRQQEERATQLANRPRVRQLLLLRASGTITAERFRVEMETVLSSLRASSTGTLALWVEDTEGSVLASSGPESL